jgi:DNA-binding transcriptional LysR family regulator
MDLRQLEYFAKVASEGTYLAAAARLSVAQPGLWRQVKELELELGVQLFERTGRRVRLTRDGRALLDQATGVLAAADRLRGAADDLRAGRTGVVSIACAAPHLREFLAPVIAELRRSNPGVRVEVREYSGGPAGRGMKGDLVDGVVDIATGMVPDDPAFELIDLYGVRLLLAVPDDHPWRDDGLVDVSRLRGVPLVTAQRDSFSRRTVEAACGRAGFAPTIGFDSPNPLSILALGSAGLGLAVLVEDAVPRPERPWPALAENGRAIADVVRLAMRKDAPRSAAVSQFVELARRHAGSRRLAAGDAGPRQPAGSRP